MLFVVMLLDFEHIQRRGGVRLTAIMNNPDTNPKKRDRLPREVWASSRGRSPRVFSGAVLAEICRGSMRQGFQKRVGGKAVVDLVNLGEVSCLACQGVL